MKKTIIKIAVFVLTFLISLIVIGKIMNQGNSNMTMDMPEATYPIVTMEKDGIAYNQLHGYGKPMDVAFQRETVTELGGNREAAFSIDTYGQSINGISIEVRSTDGSRLIENSPVTDFTQKGDNIQAKITLKDLIERDTEYALVILLETEGGGTVRYYTKVVWSDKTFAAAKLAFVKNFHDTLYDKAAAKELSIYLESNSLGDNTSFHKVDIHSSFQQITWGNMNVKEEGTPSITMTELASQTASFLIDYMVSTSEGKDKVYYQVQDYFRIRYTSERIYLLNYERTMTQIPDIENGFYANDKILLGIVDENIPFVESEDGNIVIFQVANRLCSYNVTTNKLAVMFSFYDGKNADARTMFQQHDMKILDVDEGGNVRFAVYGYMNRGRHEGDVGIQVCYYDSTLNTVEEAVYIPYDKTFAVLNSEMDKLLYMNREESLYLFLENSVYGVNLTGKTYEKIVTIDQDDSMQVSENHKILVWQEGTDIYHSTRLVCKNLNSGKENVIEAGEGEAIRPLGFMGEDVIYGVARIEDITRDNTGRVFYPMYKICIQNSGGELLKTYQQDNVYIVGCQVVDNQITFDRVLRNDDGTYEETSQDHIMNNLEIPKGKNKLVVANIDVYLKYVQIQTRTTIDSKSIKVLTPKEVVFEDGRELALSEVSETPRYYVYGAYGVSEIYNSPAKAVNLAYSLSGVVINDRGYCVWLKGNRVTRNQIMAIKEEKKGQERSSLAVCLDTILRFEGIVRNTQQLLNQGKNVTDILQESLDGAQILDLTGCNLDSILYYVNQDIPVLATLENGQAVLVTGFNEFNVVIMDPETGTLDKKGLNDSSQWFSENGNSFVTYIKNP